MSASRVCRNKFSKIYASYEKMRGEKHLKAFFSMNVVCTMDEVLSFPGFFSMEELPEYLDSVSIFSMVRSGLARIRGASFSYGQDYGMDEKITPSIVKLNNVEDGIAFFYFDQHLQNFSTKKYKVRVGVKDVSKNKAIEAHNLLIPEISFLKNSTAVIDNPLEIDRVKTGCSLARRILREKNSIYDQILKTEDEITSAQIFNLTEKMVNDLHILRMRLKKPTRSQKRNDKVIGKINLKSNAVFKIIDHDFNQEINYDFDTEFVNSSLYTEFPNLPTTSEINQEIEYNREISAMGFFVDDIPKIESKYYKKHNFENQQTMKARVGNYNLDFVNSEDVKQIQKVNLIEKTISAPVYILMGHNSGLVTAPNFVPMSEMEQELESNSTYLCKTNVVDSENQYFLLGT